MAENRNEDEFFSEEQPEPSITNVFRRPPSMKKRLAAVGAMLVLLAALFVFLRPNEPGVLWVMNPGPGEAIVEIDGKEYILAEGELLDAKVRSDPTLEVIARRSRGETAHVVDVAPAADGVTILDLAADAAYVVADVSGRYQKDARSDALEILDVSPPGEVHLLTHPANSLIRPGKPLPSNDSWELQLVPKGKNGIQVYKVFRVSPRRLEDKERLVAMLMEASKSAMASDYENLITITATTTRSPGSVIPPSKHSR